MFLLSVPSPPLSPRKWTTDVRIVGDASDVVTGDGRTTGRSKYSIFWQVFLGKLDN